MRKLRYCLCVVLFGIGTADAQPSSGAFATKRYRNLFQEAGHSQKEIGGKIQAAFRQLFHGDKDSQTVYYSAGQNANGPLAYVSDINNNDVRSEGMSYGMMIAVQMNQKAEFDALWNWSDPRRSATAGAAVDQRRSPRTCG